MQISEMQMSDITARMTEIRSLMNEENADIDALTEEVEQMEARKKELADAFEKREALAKAVSEGEGKTIAEVKVEENQEERKMGRESAEYREAFLNQLRGAQLTEEQRNALTTTTNGAVVPTITEDKILEKVREYAPLLDEITLLNVKGQVKFVIEDTVNDATVHTEGGSTSTASDTFASIVIGGYEIVKRFSISTNLMDMSIDAFENWLAERLAKDIANGIGKLIITGDGSGEPEGLYAITFDTTNSVTVSTATSVSANDVWDAIALLPGGYDDNAKFLMSKKTFFKDYANLQDKSKNSLVTAEGKKKYILGYEVMMDERVTSGDAYLGSFKEIYGNLANGIDVKKGYNFDYACDEFLGIASFDCKIAHKDAFVKIKHS